MSGSYFIHSFSYCVQVCVCTNVTCQVSTEVKGQLWVSILAVPCERKGLPSLLASH